MKLMRHYSLKFINRILNEIVNTSMTNSFVLWLTFQESYVNSRNKSYKSVLESSIKCSTINLHHKGICQSLFAMPYLGRLSDLQFSVRAPKKKKELQKTEIFSKFTTFSTLMTLIDLHIDLDDITDFICTYSVHCTEKWLRIRYPIFEYLRFSNAWTDLTPTSHRSNPSDFTGHYLS